jgi:hypothetical protein
MNYNISTGHDKLQLSCEPGTKSLLSINLLNFIAVLYKNITM